MNQAQVQEVDLITRMDLAQANLFHAVEAFRLELEAVHLHMAPQPESQSPDESKACVYTRSRPPECRACNQPQERRQVASK